MYDQRLFNQEGGMASGLASDDTYNLYDKNLWADRGNNLYKPRNPDEEGGEADGTVRQFKPDKVTSTPTLTLSPSRKLSPSDRLSQE
jgi:SNW domain-containing protein 1